MKHAIFDLHCDTLSALYAQRGRGAQVSFAKNELHVDLQKMRTGGYIAQVFAAFVNAEKVADAYVEVLAQIELYTGLVAKNPDLYPVMSARDLCAARQAGAVAAILAVEDAGVTAGEVGRVRTLFAQGVRLMTLTWNHPNAIAAPNDVARGVANTADRLRPAGVDVVREMERLGMAIDVSHLSDGGFYDVLAHTACPVLASHSCARSVCRHVRNLTDDMIYQIGNRGGVVGLNYYDAFLSTRAGGANMEDLVRHAKHIVDVGGVDVLALGSDFDGIPTSRTLPDASYLPHLWDALSRGGFTARQVEQITAGNATRFFQTVLR